MHDHYVEKFKMNCSLNLSLAILTAWDVQDHAYSTALPSVTDEVFTKGRSVVTVLNQFPLIRGISQFI